MRSLRTSRWCWVRSGERGVPVIASAVAGSPDLAVVGQARSALERELIQELRRYQVELEDRLAHVALVLLAVNLCKANLLGRQEPFLEQDCDQGLLTRRQVPETQSRAEGPAPPRGRGRAVPLGQSGTREMKNPRKRPPRRTFRPRGRPRRTGSMARLQTSRVVSCAEGGQHAACEASRIVSQIKAHCQEISN